MLRDHQHVGRDRTVQQFLRDVPAQRIVRPKRIAVPDNEEANHVYVDRGALMPLRARHAAKRRNHRLALMLRTYYPQLLMRSRFSAAKDQKLVQIVDAALADVTRRSGLWLACRLGCTQCCIGPFAINQLDAFRLEKGLADLERHAPERAVRVRERAREAVARLSPDFPGNPATGVLDEDVDSQQRFADFANDEPCPALNPETGGCELYESRPMTCRVFGPPVHSEEGLCVCELCFQGASEEEIAACEMNPDPDDLESTLLKELEKTTGTCGNTIVAFCLAS
jgi:Fe-S-cluster containining protein